MKLVGIDDQTTQAILGILSAILELGDIEFTNTGENAVVATGKLGAESLGPRSMRDYVNAETGLEPWLGLKRWFRSGVKGTDELRPLLVVQAHGWRCTARRSCWGCRPGAFPAPSSKRPYPQVREMLYDLFVGSATVCGFRLRCSCPGPQP